MSDAIQGTVAGFQSLADGTLRLKVDVLQTDTRAALDHIAENGAVVAIARLGDVQQPSKAKYGKYAEVLRRSDFFRRTAVWQAVGKDSDFLDYLRLRRCAYCGAPAPSEAAHVRRIASGAGTGEKPPYSAIPLCHEHHAAQHNQGESVLGGKEWFNKQRIKYLQEWCWNSLKEQLAFDSWAEVPPKTLAIWAIERGVQMYLPGAYQDHA